MASLVRISEAASLALHTMAVLAHEHTPHQSGPTGDQVHGASSHKPATRMALVVKGGMDQSAVGPGGGGQVARSADDGRLREIYEAAEGPMERGTCLLSEPVCDGKDCVLGELVVSVHNEIRSYLERTTLTTLTNRIGFLKMEHPPHCEG